MAGPIPEARTLAGGIPACHAQSLSASRTGLSTLQNGAASAGPRANRHLDQFRPAALCKDDCDLGSLWPDTVPDLYSNALSHEHRRSRARDTAKCQAGAIAKARADAPGATRVA